MSFRLDWQLAIRESGLRPSARHVALTLALRMDEKGVCWPSLDTLAAETGLSEKTVRLRRDDLVEAGWLVVERHRGRRGRSENVSVYRATFPSEIRSQLPDLDVEIRSSTTRNAVIEGRKSGHGYHRTRKNSKENSTRPRDGDLADAAVAARDTDELLSRERTLVEARRLRDRLNGGDA